jgi:phage terminase small subunit
MQLGLSPSSRSKLALDKVKGKEKEQDPVLSILKKNKAV